MHSHDPFLIENLETHDVRYFAMLNNAVAISGDDELEGGDPSKSLAYYNYLINMKLPNCPASLNLPDELLKPVNKRMQDLMKINALLENLFLNRSLYTVQGLDNVINTIQTNCSEEGSCYLPTGYRNYKKDGKKEGHFAGLKIRKLENGHYAFSCINHGDGMRYHRQTSTSETKVKYSYQSDEFEIDLQQKEGREFLKRILELNFDEKQDRFSANTTNPYSSDDLYGLIALYPLRVKMRTMVNLEFESYQ